MHHVIAPSQSIVYPLRLLGAMAAAASHSNKTAWHLTSRFVRYLSGQIICRLSTSFRSCIHCIATRVAMRVDKGSQFSPRSSIFHFEFRSQMNLVSSLFF